MAAETSRTPVYGGIYGCYPLPCTQRRPDCQECRIYCHWHTPQGYFVDEAKAEAFDKDFPFKEKLVLPGQIF